MRIGFAVLYAVAIIVPTALLAYFGLLSVRSEKSIVEANMMQKYEAIAGLVEGEVNKTLSSAQEDLLENPKYVEHMMLEQAALFRDDVAILDAGGRSIGEEMPAKPMLVRQIKGYPYKIAVYERYPVVLDKIGERQRNLSLYIAIIYLSAFLILSGGFISLWSLSKQWNLARMKNEFVSHLAHDLRRPLTSIRMFSEMLKTGRVADDAKRAEYYKIISGESEKLTHLANNILDFSRIEMGRKSYKFKKEDIGRVVSDAVERFKLYIADEQRPVTLNISGDIPPVRMDDTAISQVIINLLTNASKYSAPTTPITVNLARDERGVAVEVIDRGIGIPKEEIRKIFGKFYRAHEEKTADIEGSGLGLALVKYIAEAHKGHIKVESEEGKGSRFTLILPV